MLGVPIIKYFKDECFRYDWVSISKSYKGWHATAIDGLRSYKLKPIVKGYKVVSLDDAFSNYDITGVDLSNINTSNIVSMDRMFSHCKASKIDISNFDMSNVTSADLMFNHCYLTDEIVLPNCKLDKLLSAHGMFKYCMNLRKITNIDKFECDRIQDAGDIFYKCRGLTRIDISKLNLGSVNYIGGAFHSALEECEYIIVDDKFIYEKIKEQSDMNKPCLIDNIPSNIDNTLSKIHMLGYNSICVIDKGSL